MFTKNRENRNRTKNKTVRSIPMHPKVIDYFQSLPRPLKGGFVFSKRCFNRRAYDKAVEMSSLGDFTFHDLRHCAINNLRLAGNDHFAIKKISGHKTDSAFQRYNLVTEEEMKDWPKNPLVNLEKPFVDLRGSIQPLVDSLMKSAVMIHSNAGSLRANHYHKTDWHYCYVITGSIEYFHRPTGSKEDPEKIYFVDYCCLRLIF